MTHIVNVLRIIHFSPSKSVFPSAWIEIFMALV